MRFCYDKLIRTGRQKGLTLTEILVYMGILSITLVAIAAFVLGLVRSRAKTEALHEVQDNIRRAMKSMVYEIREAESIYSPTSNSSQLSLETKEYLMGGEETTFIDFFLCDKKLCLKKESQNPIVITSDKVEVNDLIFTQIGSPPSSVRIELTIDYKTQDRIDYQVSVSSTSAASLRSY